MKIKKDQLIAIAVSIAAGLATNLLYDMLKWFVSKFT